MLLSSRQLLVPLLLLATKQWCCVYAGVPRPAQYYKEQDVDHLNRSSNNPFAGQQWAQRFYTYSDHFAGPGSPIFVILGGEGKIEPSTGIMYPFIADHLAASFGAYVLEPEHRFYGESQPLADLTTDIRTQGEEDPRVQLFTSEQALCDAFKLLMITRTQLGCSWDRFSPSYCPVITVGGSYPGWLSAMARILFPHFVDMAYAGSAPMKFYAQQVDSFAYYDHISAVAEKAYPTCSSKVRATLDEVVAFYRVQSRMNASLVGVCEYTLPGYIGNDTATFIDELIMMTGYSFANANMGYYPPTNTSWLYRACDIFATDKLPALGRLKKFLIAALTGYDDAECFDMRRQLPTGPNATISGGDWSGDGTGQNGESWDFQTCTLLVEAIGFGPKSMFPPRNWTLEWLNEHCQSRFGVTPRPYELVSKWHFDNLTQAKASRILFTNGLNDGWSVSAVTNNVSGSIAINFPNGAHHSDLNRRGPSDEDTQDIRQGFQQIRTILAQWLSELPGGRFARSRSNR